MGRLTHSSLRQIWVYSSAVERLTADQQVPGSNPGAPYYTDGASLCVYIHMVLHKSVIFYYVRISGLVVEYIVAIDVTRVRFPADAFWIGKRLGVN
jgi:hypothetical protein